MNTRPAIESSNTPGALSVSFNQDASCFAVGLENGFSIYRSDPCKLHVVRDFNAGIATVGMLGTTNYLALVGGGKNPKYAQNKVIIWDDSKQKVIFTLPALTTVRGVRISKTHIVIVLQSSVKVYKFQVPPQPWGEYQTVDNPSGICCLGTKHLAIPAITAGQVRLIELGTKNVSLVPAHNSPLRALDISRDGQILATASETGTLIRVFAIPSFSKLAELRRGVDAATIFSLAIAPSGQILAVTSDKSTLHIFDIPHPTKPARVVASNVGSRSTAQTGGVNPAVTDGDTSQKWGVLGKIPLLPKFFSDTYSFASATFEIGDEGSSEGSTISGTHSELGLKLSKGTIGWVSDDCLIIVGAGKDSRWERFVIGENRERKRECERQGWKRYRGAT